MMIDRRSVLKAMAVVPAAAWMEAALPVWTASASDVVTLESLFETPPDEARPWVYWFWINGNVTREGITADLEAMRRVGLGGALMFDVDPGTPSGPAPFGSKQWQQNVDFAVMEATRLGLKLGINNGPGWAGSAGPWVTPELAAQKVVWSEARFTGEAPMQLELPEVFKGYYRDIAVMAFPYRAGDRDEIEEIAFKSAQKTGNPAWQARFGIPPLHAVQTTKLAIDPAQVHDVSKFFDGQILNWDAPPGEWMIVRFGHTATGKDNHPVAESARGLECDKMNPQAVQFHFEQFIGRSARRLSPAVGHAWMRVHIDSWEAGPQNWTADFQRAFIARRGYDMTPWLPVMTGRVVGSAERSERFLADVRQTVSDLVIENYAAQMQRLAKNAGLQLSIEAYDGDPTDQMEYAGRADVPQTEFWYGRDFFPGVYRSWGWVQAMTSAAHVYGKAVVSAEAFTAMPGEDWQAHPALLKPLGDWALCKGVNHFIFHRFAMQPWLNRAPGMTMGPWGVHYDRTQTWWEASAPWHRYLTRTQFLLRQGLFVADLLYLTPEAAPQRLLLGQVDIQDSNPPQTPGYNFDACPAEVLRERVSIVDGWITLPDGMRYQILVLPEADSLMPGAGRMTPELLKRMLQLVEQGMVVVGPPPTSSPSLRDYPQADQEVARLVQQLWGDCDGIGSTVNHVGKGRVHWGPSPQDVLREMEVPEDFSCGEDQPFHYMHRRLADGTELYFVANRLPEAVTATCRFRVENRTPELWNPETGERYGLARYAQLPKVTALPLTLGGYDSVFIVFKAASHAVPSVVTSVARDGIRQRSLQVVRENAHVLRLQVDAPGEYDIALADGRRIQRSIPALPPSLAIPGPWVVQFQPGRGAPEQPQSFEQLRAWNSHDEPGIRYFSGKALYRNFVDVPAALLQAPWKLYLNLGRVEVIAQVRVNGGAPVVLWRPPFRADVTSMLRPGRNQLEIEVINLWPNRIIGDEQLAPDAQWEPGGFGGLSGFGDRLSAWPQWLLDGKPSPTGRQTFATWRVWSKSSKLLDSGLLGPVTLDAEASVRLALE